MCLLTRRERECYVVPVSRRGGKRQERRELDSLASASYELNAAKRWRNSCSISSGRCTSLAISMRTASP